MSSQPWALLAELEELMDGHEQRLESLDSRLSALEPKLKRLASSPPVLGVSPTLTYREFEFRPKSFDGVISYLTVKHGGNVDRKGVVTITSNCKGRDSVRHIADLTSRDCLRSVDLLGFPRAACPPHSLCNQGQPYGILGG
jgi:hypothetical protein